MIDLLINNNVISNLPRYITENSMQFKANVEYLQIKPKSIISFHITNNFYDLYLHLVKVVIIVDGIGTHITINT